MQDVFGSRTPLTRPAHLGRVQEMVDGAVSVLRLRAWALKPVTGLVLVRAWVEISTSRGRRRGHARGVTSSRRYSAKLWVPTIRAGVR